MSNFNTDKFGEIYKTYGEKVNIVKEQITQALDNNDASLALETLKMMHTNKMFVFCPLESEFHWKAYLDMKLIKEAGNSCYLDESLQRVVIFSRHAAKSNMFYLYDPLTQNWRASSNPEKEWYCFNVDHLLKKFINAPPPWSK